MIDLFGLARLSGLFVDFSQQKIDIRVGGLLFDLLVQDVQGAGPVALLVEEIRQGKGIFGVLGP